MSHYHAPTDREMREMRKLIPKHIPFTLLHIALEALAAAILLAMVLYLWHVWPALAETIPTHYGITGQANGWGSKNALLFLPITGILVYVLITVLLFFPKIWNVPYRFDASNVIWTFQTLRSMMVWLNLAVAAIFAYLSVASAAAAQSLPPFFFIITMIALFVPIIYYWRRLKVRLTHAKED